MVHMGRQGRIRPQGVGRLTDCPLNDPLDPARHGGRTPAGVPARAARRQPAPAAAIWHSRRIGTGGKAIPGRRRPLTGKESLIRTGPRRRSPAAGANADPGRPWDPGCGVTHVMKARQNRLELRSVLVVIGAAACPPRPPGRPPTGGRPCSLVLSVPCARQPPARHVPPVVPRDVARVVPRAASAPVTGSPPNGPRASAPRHAGGSCWRSGRSPPWWPSSRRWSRSS